jgi:DNA-binding NtrC family response regulator
MPSASQPIGSWVISFGKGIVVFNGVLIVEKAGASARESGCRLSIGFDWRDSICMDWADFRPECIRTIAGLRLIIADAADAGAGARAFFAWLRQYSASAPVCAIVPADDPELLHLAAEVSDEFILGSPHSPELARRVARLLGPCPPEHDDLAYTLATELGLREMVGRSPAFQKVVRQMSQFAGNEAPVLLTGETGTGKELGARVMHLLSRRRTGPFIPVDCGAIPEHLFENEIFGHARGAFTDARNDQQGLVALANKGTLFLDEVDSLPLGAQSKVLRLLQEQTYRPLGSDVFHQANVRVLAATNRDLEHLVAQKMFRADLFFRINVLRVHLPPLRERRADIALLGQHFVQEICAANQSPRKKLSAAALLKLERYDWPGNIRELYNILQRAVLCSAGVEICASVIELNGQDPPDPGAHPFAQSQSFRKAKLEAIQSFEGDYVRSMLEKHDGNVTQAAREAGKDRRAFGRLAKKYGEGRDRMPATDKPAP